MALDQHPRIIRDHLFEDTIDYPAEIAGFEWWVSVVVIAVLALVAVVFVRQRYRRLGVTNRGVADTVTTTALSKWFGPKVAVSEVTIGFGPGVTGLLGPNGAGKTTLMRVVAGLQRPSQGEVSVLGVNPRKTPSVYKKVALVPEDEAIYERLTARQFISLAAQLAKVEDPAAHTQRVLETVDLVDSAHRQLGGFSKGMRQRAKVAAALVSDPEVLLLDGTPQRGRPGTEGCIDPAVPGAWGGRAHRDRVVSCPCRGRADGRTDCRHGRWAAGGSGECRDDPSRHDRPAPPGLCRLLQPREHWPLLSSRPAVWSGSVCPDPNWRIEASDAGVVAMALPKLAVEKGISISRLEPADESLESVFRYLVESN